MKSSIFIPKKINVGFQKRKGTYTGKLAYVIYFDEKGKLRKEPSWKSWRDESIDNLIYDNTPLEGFVLNKKAGGVSSGWNYRQSYVRVYDPRGFEFEITVENLLYILDNTNSIKGKGLEGEFVYGWDGGDLVLLPTLSSDYEEIRIYNQQRHSTKKIGVKDLIIGGTYKDKNNSDFVYMGKFDKWINEYDYQGNERNNVNKGKHHFFCRIDKYQWSNDEFLNIIMTKSPSSRFIGVVSEDISADFDNLFEKLEKNVSYSPYDVTKDEFIPYSLEEFKSSFKHTYCYVNGEKVSIEKDYNSVEPNYILTNPKVRYDPRKSETFIAGTLEEIFSKLEITYKNRYLANGKLLETGLRI